MNELSLDHHRYSMEESDICIYYELHNSVYIMDQRIENTIKTKIHDRTVENEGSVWGDVLLDADYLLIK